MQKANIKCKYLFPFLFSNLNSQLVGVIGFRNPASGLMRISIPGRSPDRTSASSDLTEIFHHMLCPMISKSLRLGNNCSRTLINPKNSYSSIPNAMLGPVWIRSINIRHLYLITLPERAGRPILRCIFIAVCEGLCIGWPLEDCGLRSQTAVQFEGIFFPMQTLTASLKYCSSFLSKDTRSIVHRYRSVSGVSVANQG